jgi:hypothetical protein
MFKEVTGTQEERPEEFDFDGSPGKVYVRKNIRRETITSGEEEMEVWKYQEALMTFGEFNVYSQAVALENQNAMDATLAEILLNQMEV